MTTHTSSPGRRADAHISGWLVFAAVGALVIRGLCVAPRPMKD